MKLTISVLLVLIVIITKGQDEQLEGLYKLYLSGDIDQTIEKAESCLANDPNNVDYHLLLGRALTDKGKFGEALPVLSFTVENDRGNTWRKAWALGYLGTCYFMLGEYEKSAAATQEAFDMQLTRNASRYSHIHLLLFGFDAFYRNWKIVESEHFRFHFQNMSDADLSNYIASRESAFDQINEFFAVSLPKKIDFFVWNSHNDALKLLKRNLGFADPGTCVVHAHFQQTRGHEMTHVISHYSAELPVKTGLINEGTAVCFDLSNNDREKMVKDWLATNEKSIAIKEIWTNWKAYPDELSYPLSGLFVQRLIDQFGREKFLEFFSKQSYENAKVVFGDELDRLIQDFEEQVNL